MPAMQQIKPAVRDAADDHVDRMERISRDPDGPWGDGRDLLRFADGGAGSYFREGGPLVVSVDAKLIRRASAC